MQQTTKLTADELNYIEIQKIEEEALIDELERQVEFLEIEMQYLKKTRFELIMWITDKTMEMKQSDIRQLLFNRYGCGPTKPIEAKKINRPPMIGHCLKTNLKIKKNGK